MTSNNQLPTGDATNRTGQVSASNGENDWGGQSYEELANQWGTSANQNAVQSPVKTKKELHLGVIFGAVFAFFVIIAVLLTVVGKALGWFGESTKADSESVVTSELQSGGASLGEGRQTGREALGGSQVDAEDFLTSGSLDEELENQSRVEFTNFSPVTTITSWEFSQEVGNAFVEHYERTGEFDATLQVASPVTGRTYTMTCAGSSSSVTCTGGNNAVVHIS